MVTINLLEAFSCLCDDIGLDPQTVGYCLRRLKAEGVPFLTVTLPKLARHVLLSIESGFFIRSLDGVPQLTDFAWKSRSLRYFRSLLDRIFCPLTGELSSIPDALALYQLRQLCEYAYKLALPFSEMQLSTAATKFVEVDASVKGVGEYDSALVDQLRKDVSTFYPALIRTGVDEILKSCPPRSGPGTFADTWDEQWAWYVRRFRDYRTPRAFAPVCWANRPNQTRSAPNSAVYDPSEFSEVLFVPKDSRGPRTIVREPYGALRFQMSYNKFLGDFLETATRNRINFQEQQVNRDLAFAASTSREWATIDLQDASDRVSAAIVSHVFRDCPGLRFFLDRRTKVCRLPSGEFKLLKKLAGMGSGFTFPTMSFLIHLVITRYMTNILGRPYKWVGSKVYVYGDDIIVPTSWTHHAYKALDSIGLKVNERKSYWRGPFRESCGGDYLNGNDVTPVRLKLSSANPELCGPTSVRLSGPLGIVALERHCRELVKAGLLTLAEYYYSVLERRLGSLPYVSGESPALGRYSPQGCDVYLTDETGSYELVKACIPVPVAKKAPRDPYVHLATELERLPAEWWECSGPGLAVTEVAKPRAVKLLKRRVSAFRLMG